MQPFSSTRVRVRTDFGRRQYHLHTACLLLVPDKDKGLVAKSVEDKDEGRPD